MTNPILHDIIIKLSIAQKLNRTKKCFSGYIQWSHAWTKQATKQSILSLIFLALLKQPYFLPKLYGLFFGSNMWTANMQPRLSILNGLMKNSICLWLECKVYYFNLVALDGIYYIQKMFQIHTCYIIVTCK